MDSVDGKNLIELDRIAKMLIRRDLVLSELKEKREKELQQLKEKTKDLENARSALMNMLEDVEKARNRAEEERDRTAIIIKSFADGLLFFKNNKIALINPKIEKFFGVSEKEIVGMTLSDLAKDKKFKVLLKLIKEKGNSFSREELVWGKDLAVEVSSTPVLKEKKNVGKIIIFHDISREKMIERMKTEFVSIAAHQLRTPLSAMKWILKMMIDGDLGKLTKNQKGFLEKTYQSNERMIHLINDLLNVARIEEGRFLQDVKKMDIVNMIEKRVVIARGLLKNKKVKLTFTKPKVKIPKINIDAEKMYLVVQNLIDNAVYCTKEGKIEVAIDLTKDKNNILISIADTGIGIAQDQQPRIFTKFFRGANAVRMKTEGSGLGLFIVKNIINAHQGKIWFKSQEGKGSTFYFTLPIK